MKRAFTAAVLALGAVLAGGGAVGWTEQERPAYPAAQAPPSLRPAIVHADLVIVTLQGALLSELRHRLAEFGPAFAFDACHLSGLRVARQVARQEGVVLGRTSARLRNPANAPPSWAAAIVQRYADHREAGVDGFAIDLDDRVGVMRPIREQPICASCHGPEQNLSAGVRERLAARYPADRAIGFREGDIRGWFWVEVPKKPRPSVQEW